MEKKRHSTLPALELISKWKVPVLLQNDVHVWFSEWPEQIRLLDYFWSILSAEEQRQAAFFLVEKVKNRYIISHGILRSLLGAYAGIQPEQIEITRNESGKPVWLNQPLHFNLSHSGDYCSMAFSELKEVGIDVEQIRELGDMEQLIQLNFSTGEQKFIYENPLEYKERFFQMWTLKESFLKATGLGMQLDPSLIELSCSDNRYELKKGRTLSDERDYKFSSFKPNALVSAALCCHADQKQILTFTID
ncbi:MAG: 4'-phosphopantetheinyl transferase superfamily protein [Bacteroidetes bacterium]|nr:4'-phosphopantetheinyl transferase superfamily protein [Bacteroidota bacterium]